MRIFWLGRGYVRRANEKSCGSVEMGNSCENTTPKKNVDIRARRDGSSSRCAFSVGGITIESASFFYPTNMLGPTDLFWEV